MYTAAVLTTKSQGQLIAHFASVIPASYETIAHHMTINMGGMPESTFKIGDPVKLTVMSFAQNDKVMAVGVQTDCPSKNAIKHITLAVNRIGGGKPFHSNQLTEWHPITNFELDAVIQECQ